MRVVALWRIVVGVCCVFWIAGCGESPQEKPPQAVKADVQTPKSETSAPANREATAADKDSTAKPVDSVTEKSDSDPTAKTASANVPTTDGSEPAGPLNAKGEELPPTKLPADLLEGSKLTPLNPQGTVLLDFPGKRVLLKTKVCLTRGALEMFLCLKQTKEHESILSIDSEAFTIHGALVALGAKEGRPVQFSPEYVAPSGDKIDVFVHWVDANGKLFRRPAQQWMRHSRDRFHEEPFDKLPDDIKIPDDSNLRYDPTNKFLIWYGPMTTAERDGLLKLSKDKKYRVAIERFYQEGLPRETKADFVFVGSGFSEDADNGKRYLAEGGYVICVANFQTAMIDVAVQSSASGTENLNFEAWQERLPPSKSEVLVELVVRKSEEKAEKSE